MEIYLIRHTTPDIEKGICYGQSDIDVTTTFETEVKQIHSIIGKTDASKIYSSPLQRCMKLAKTFGSPVHYMDHLKELDFGDWELKPWNEIPPSELNPWMENFVHIAPPNGESYQTLQQRAISCFNMIMAEIAQSSILITHAGTIRALLAHLLGIALKDSFQIKLKYGQVIKLQYKDHAFKILEGLTLEKIQS
ncbi:alpha-ribazole phosphatase [Flagellimonas algicola]|uniref:Alpha-ribazole phosphatase n=1 Tax=Flagellimonas algicola TaxID=2583815 RepID=A0ABY2WPI1_9FLAO|nr:alpha-ribazole phosphatase [Allomuricauda algicola]TMU56893.1 alpha-ribazole phosphatase [Allomuricauda algicola]